MGKELALVPELQVGGLLLQASSSLGVLVTGFKFISRADEREILASNLVCLAMFFLGFFVSTI